MKKLLSFFSAGVVCAATLNNPVYAKELIPPPTYVYEYTGADCYCIVTNLPPKLAVSYGPVDVTVRNHAGYMGINAGAWTELGEMGLTYSDGIWYSSQKPYVGDTLILTQEGELKALGYDYVTVEMIEELNPRWAVTGYNAVIWDRVNHNFDWTDKHYRSFIGQLKNGDYFFGISKIKWSYEDMYNYAINTFGDQVVFMYNLDGGGSCGLYTCFKGYTEGRDVKSVIYF